MNIFETLILLSVEVLNDDLLCFDSCFLLNWFPHKMVLLLPTL